MSDEEALARRTENVEVIREIISSMRALSGLQVRQAVSSLQQLREYSWALEGALAALAQDRPITPRPRKVLVIAYGSDQGLCGPLTQRVVDVTSAHLDRLGERSAGVVAVGRRVFDTLLARGVEPRGWQRTPASVRGVDDRVAGLARLGQGLFDTGQADGAEAIYPRHLGVGRYEVEIVRIYPLDEERLVLRRATEGVRRSPRLLESSAEVFGRLIEEWLYIELYRATLEALASEHGARLRTTDAAMSAIDKKLEDLHVERNHARQEAITAELQEIVNASELMLLPTASRPRARVRRGRPATARPSGLPR